jgi:hypothetical protein
MSGTKRVLALVLLLGVVGALIYVLRARRSSSEPVPAAQLHVHEERDEPAGEMGVHEAGSATA